MVVVVLTLASAVVSAIGVPLFLAVVVGLTPVQAFMAAGAAFVLAVLVCGLLVVAEEAREALRRE